jgi:hypothetical protein
MNTQPTTPNKINFLGVVDNFIIYAIGSNVYQIEVDQDDLEFVFGTETREWESPLGQHYSDDCATISCLSEVYESDYLTVIESLQSHAQDITDSYENPVTAFEKEIERITLLSTEEHVKSALVQLMIDSRYTTINYK